MENGAKSWSGVSRTVAVEPSAVRGDLGPVGCRHAEVVGQLAETGGIGGLPLREEDRVAARLELDPFGPRRVYDADHRRTRFAVRPEHVQREEPDELPCGGNAQDDRADAQERAHSGEDLRAAGRTTGGGGRSGGLG